jgi:hypothetical protein
MNDDLFPDLIAAVEQQLLSPQTPYVKATLERLTAAGMERDEALAEIALCLGEEMDQMLARRGPFDASAYQSRLDLLPPLEK